eukprot:12397808-Karenia_brevis.AAC.1
MRRVPSNVMIKGRLTASRQEWRSEARQACSARYFDPTNDGRAADLRMLRLESAIKAAQLDGILQSKLDFQT